MWYEGMFHTCPFSFQHHSTRHGPGQAAVPRVHSRKVLNPLAPCPSPHQGIHGRDVPHPSQTRAEQCHNLDLKSGLRSHLPGRTAAGSEVQKWDLKAKDLNITNIYLWLSLQMYWHKTYDLYLILTVPFLWNLLFCWYFTSKALLWRIIPPSGAAQKILQKRQSTGNHITQALTDWPFLPKWGCTDGWDSQECSYLAQICFFSRVSDALMQTYLEPVQVTLCYLGTSIVKWH